MRLLHYFFKYGAFHSPSFRLAPCGEDAPTAETSKGDGAALLAGAGAEVGVGIPASVLGHFSIQDLLELRAATYRDLRLPLRCLGPAAEGRVLRLDGCQVGVLLPLKLLQSSKLRAPRLVKGPEARPLLLGVAERAAGPVQPLDALLKKKSVRKRHWHNLKNIS